MRPDSAPDPDPPSGSGDSPAASGPSAGPNKTHGTGTSESSGTLNGSDPPDGGPSKLYRLAWWFYLAVAVAGVVWIGWREGAPRLGLFVDPGTWWIDLGLGLATGLGLVGLWEVARRILPRAKELEDKIAEALGGLTVSEAAALALLSGFSEELFFRGAVQGAFDYLPWLWTAGLFAILHTGPGRAFRLWTLFAFLAGIALGLLMEFRGNLLAPVVAHVTVNGINLVRMVRAASPPAHSESQPSTPS